MATCLFTCNDLIKLLQLFPITSTCFIFLKAFYWSLDIYFPFLSSSAPSSLITECVATFSFLEGDYSKRSYNRQLGEKKYPFLKKNIFRLASIVNFPLGYQYDLSRIFRQLQFAASQNSREWMYEGKRGNVFQECGGTLSYFPCPDPTCVFR